MLNGVIVNQSIFLGNGLVPPGNKTLPGPIETRSHGDIHRYLGPTRLPMFLFCWWLCCQPIKSQGWTFLLNNKDFDMQKSMSTVKNITSTLLGNKIVHHPAPTGAAPNKSSIST